MLNEREVLSWGLMHPSSEPSILPTESVEDACELLYLHRVAKIAAHRAQERGALEMSDILAAKRTPYDERFASTPEVLDLVFGSGSKVRLMKGMAVAGWYGLFSRDIGDVDVWVDSMDDAFALATHLQDNGYLYSSAEPAWLKRNEAGDLYGQIRMVDVDFVRMSVDIHAGPYSVRYGGVLPFPKASSLDNGDSLSVDDSVCAAIGNAAGDCAIDAKLLNDLHLAAEIGFDYDYVVASLASAQIEGFGAVAARNVLDLCQVSGAAAALLGRLSDHPSPEYVPISHTANSAERASVVAAHTYRLGWSRGLSLERCELLAAEAFKAYTQSNEVRLKTGPYSPVDFSMLDPFTCVRLLPDAQLSDEIRSSSTAMSPSSTVPISKGLDLLRCGNSKVVVYRGQKFVATVDYSIPAAP